MKQIQKKFPTRLLLCLVLSLALLCGTAAAAVPPVLFTSGSVTIDGTESLTGPARLFRDTIGSTVGSPKTFPGVFGSGTYYFEVVEILPASQSDYNAQITVTDTEIFGNLFCAAYTDSFDPADLSANYLGDPGRSSTTAVPVTFSVTVPAGKSLLLVAMSSLPIYSPGTNVGTNSYEVTLLSLPTFSVTVDSAAGGSSGADIPVAAFGDTVTLTANPTGGYAHTGWEVVSPIGLAVTGNTFEMPGGPVTVRPVFQPLPVSLTLTGPHKTGYDEGDPLSLAGLVVSAHYSDSSSQIITGYTVSPPEGSILAPGHNSVTVTYEELGVTRTASYVIEVFPRNKIPKTGDAGVLVLVMTGCAAALVFTAVRKSRQQKGPR